MGRRESLWGEQAGRRKHKCEQCCPPPRECISMGTTCLVLTGHVQTRREGAFSVGAAAEKTILGKPQLWVHLSSGTKVTFSDLKSSEFWVSEELWVFYHILFTLETRTEASGCFSGNTTGCVKTKWNGTQNSILCRRLKRSNSWTQVTLLLLAYSKWRVIASSMLRKQQARPHRLRTTSPWKRKASHQWTKPKEFEKTFREGWQRREKKHLGTYWEGARWKQTLHNLRTQLWLYYQRVVDAKHPGAEGEGCIQFNLHSKQIRAI